MNSIRSVAEKAGVSSCTVSKVLNGVPSRITPETRDRVVNAARALGYQPNRFARGLGKRRTQTIALLIGGLQNPYFVSLAEAAEKHLLAAGYQVVLDAAPPQGEVYGRPAKLRGWPLDGVLMAGGESQHVGEYLGEGAMDVPTIYLGIPRADGEDAVYFDYKAGGYATGAHFAERGYQRVLFISNIPPRFISKDLRHRGFLEACERFGLSVEEADTDFMESRAAGYRLGEAIAKRPAADRPRAICCHNDLIAVGLCRALQRAGLRIPEDIAVSGFDGIEDGQFLERPLTTVVGSASEMMAAASGLLLARIEGGLKPTGEQVMIPSRLQIGGTT